MAKFESPAVIEERKAAERGALRFKRDVTPENFQAPKEGRFTTSAPFGSVRGRLTPREEYERRRKRLRAQSAAAEKHRGPRRHSEWGYFVNEKGQRVCGVTKKDGKVCMATTLLKDGHCVSHSRKGGQRPAASGQKEKGGQLEAGSRKQEAGSGEAEAKAQGSLSEGE